MSPRGQNRMSLDILRPYSGMRDSSLPTSASWRREIRRVPLSELPQSTLTSRSIFSTADIQEIKLSSDYGEF